MKILSRDSIRQFIYHYLLILPAAMIVMMLYLIGNPLYTEDVSIMRQLLDSLLIAFIFGNGVFITVLLSSEIPMHFDGRWCFFMWIIGMLTGVVIAGVTWFTIQIMQVQIINNDTFGEALVWLFVLFPYFDNIPILLWGAFGLSAGFGLMMPLIRYPVLQIIGTISILSFALIQANHLNPVLQGNAANWCCGLIDFVPGEVFVPVLFVLVLAIVVHIGRYYAIMMSERRRSA